MIEDESFLEEILQTINVAIEFENEVWKYMLKKGYVQQKVKQVKRVYDEFKKEFPEEYALDLAKWYISSFKVDYK